MEEKKTIFDYLAQVMCIFGFSILFIAVIIRFFGGDMGEKGEIFFLQGNESLPVHIIFQFFLLSIVIEAICYLIMTDWIIKRVNVVMRTVITIFAVLIVSSLFVILFRWFPINDWQYWRIFIFCFILCSVVSVMITMINDRLENKKLEQGLEKLQRKWEKEDER